MSNEAQLMLDVQARKLVLERAQLACVSVPAACRSCAGRGRCSVETDALSMISASGPRRYATPYAGEAAPTLVVTNQRRRLRRMYRISLHSASGFPSHREPAGSGAVVAEHELGCQPLHLKTLRTVCYDIRRRQLDTAFQFETPDPIVVLLPICRLS